MPRVLYGCALLLSLWIAGCGDDADACGLGEAGCACWPDESCGTGLECISGICVGPGDGDGDDATRDGAVPGDPDAAPGGEPDGGAPGDGDGDVGGGDGDVGGDGDGGDGDSGDGDSGDGDTTDAGLPPLEATILFPIGGMTGADSVVVRGLVDPDAVTAVQVNGQDATLDADGHFTRAVALSLGDNEIVVSASDAAQTTDRAAVVEVLRSAPWFNPAAITRDPSDGALFVTDFTADAVFRVEPDGNRTLVSSVLRGTGPEMGAPIAIAYDASGDRLFVTNNGSDDILIVDPDSGDRTVLTDPSPSADTTLSSPYGMALHAASGTLYIADATSDQVLSVNTATGARALVSSNSQPNGNPMFDFSAAVDLAVVNATTLAVLDDGYTSVLTVDVASGDRTLISDNDDAGLGTALTSPQGIAADAPNNRVIVVETAGVMAINLANGQRTPISGIAGTGGGLEIFAGDRVVLDGADLALVTDQYTDVVFEVELSTGNRTLRSDGRVGAGAALVSGYALAWDGTDTVLAASSDLTGARMARIDLLSGDRSLIPDDPAASTPIGIMDVDWRPGPGAELIALTLNGSLQSELIAIDPSSGTRRVISAVDQLPVVTASTAMAVIDANTAVFSQVTADAVLAVDLTNGARTVFTDGVAEPVLDAPGGMRWDASGSRLLVCESGTSIEGGVVAVTAAGVRSLLSGELGGLSAGSGPALDWPAKLVIDQAGGRVFVADRGVPTAIYSVALSDGARELISGGARGEGPTMVTPENILYDATRDILIVGEREMSALLVVDVATGDRMVVSK